VFEQKTVKDGGWMAMFSNDQNVPKAGLNTSDPRLKNV
jgi:hypothetical protein